MSMTSLHTTSPLAVDNMSEIDAFLILLSSFLLSALRETMCTDAPLSTMHSRMAALVARIFLTTRVFGSL